MTQAQPRRLAVEIWSDIACPWCYIGKRRLETALSKVPFADAVSVNFHAFELDPAAPRVYPKEPSHAARLATKYRLPLARAEQMLAEMTERGRADGILFDFSALVGVNTFLAHQLMCYARTQSKRGGLAIHSAVSLSEALFAGYFTQGRDLSDVNTLVEIAVGVGLPEPEARAVLLDQTYAAQVREDETAAQQLRITAVPFFIIGQYGIPGAQPVETFSQALQQAWDATQPST